MPKFRTRGVKRGGLTARLAFNAMGFDAVKEWIIAFNSIESPEERIRALEKVFEYIYPKIGPADPMEAATLELQLGSEDLKLLEDSDNETLIKALTPSAAEQE